MDLKEMPDPRVSKEYRELLVTRELTELTELKATRDFKV